MKFLKFSSILLLWSSSVKSQSNLTFPIRPLQGIEYAEKNNVSKDSKKYPYCNVSVLVRNADKLTSENYVKNNFKTLQYFYSELTLSKEGSQPQKVPLFLFEKNKEKGTYNTSQIQDRTIIQKYLYNEDENIDARISTDITIRNGALDILNSLTPIISPLISNPASLVSKEQAVKTFNFFTDLLGKAAAKNQLESNVDFELFKSTNEKVLDYDIFFIVPNEVRLPPPANLQLTKDYFIRQNGQNYFEDYPYIIVLKTVTNYNSYIKGLPSEKIERNGLDIEDKDINDLRTSLYSNEKKLSDQQNFAEKVLLYHLSLLNNLKKTIHDENNEINSTSYEEILKYANAKMQKTEEWRKIEPDLLISQEAKYQSALHSLTENIDTESKKLPYYIDLLKLDGFNKSSDLKIKDSELARLHSIVKKLSAVTFLQKNSALILSQLKVQDVEQEIYNGNFQQYCNILGNATEINKDADSSKFQLNKLINEYSNCKKCIDEANISISKYNNLLNSEEDRKLYNYIKDTIFAGNDFINKYKLKLETFKILPDNVKVSQSINAHVQFITSDIELIEKEILDFKKIEKTKFSKSDRKDIYSSLDNFGKHLNKFDLNYKSLFDLLK